jgi:isopentenyl diphosphate isomerase/L-lactate dehydrogenase-like FMN-dependent dehydrogenase
MVAKMLDTLRAELAVAMILTGCVRVRDAGPSLVDAS